MTSRIDNPDTPADIELHSRLNDDGLCHFLMTAGAGSGKTTSLVKALNYLSEMRGDHLRRQAQQIACITYTDVAVKEIYGDVSHDTLFHVSTIHSFLWIVIRPFQDDLRTWVLQRIDEKILESEEKIIKPRTHEATKLKERLNIERYREQVELVKIVKSFRYGTGSDYANGILGHSDILKIGTDLISSHGILQKVIAQRFPVIFVDESQDTIPDFIKALKKITSSASTGFCLGFFGDPMQKIYMDGIGEIPEEVGWLTIQKPENFRCPVNVLNVINNIRAEGDGLHQIRGKTIEIDGVQTSIQGTARAFILPSDKRTEGLTSVRAWLAQQNNDPLWLSDTKEGDVRMLVVVHRIAASRLGFPDIYSALNDKSPESLKSGLIDGTAWVVRPFIQYIIPLLQARTDNDDFKVMSILRNSCPRLDPDYIFSNNLATELASLNDDLTALGEMFADRSQILIGDVINFVQKNNLLALDERFFEPLSQFISRESFTENAPENSVLRFLNCSANQVLSYRTYIEEQSPFATQQGIKGAEFDRVLVVVDDEESTTTSFSYGKYFDMVPLSETDIDNIQNGRDSVVDRTRRLFYVCCSRAVQDLAVVIFTEDTEMMRSAIETKGFFPSNDIHVLDI